MKSRIKHMIRAYVYLVHPYAKTLVSLDFEVGVNRSVLFNKMGSTLYELTFQKLVAETYYFWPCPPQQ